MGRSAADRSRRTILPDAARMASVEIPADGNAIVLRGVDVRLLGKLLNQQLFDLRRIGDYHPQR